MRVVQGEKLLLDDDCSDWASLVLESHRAVSAFREVFFYGQHFKPYRS